MWFGRLSFVVHKDIEYKFLLWVNYYYHQQKISRLKTSFAVDCWCQAWSSDIFGFVVRLLVTHCIPSQLKSKKEELALKRKRFLGMNSIIMNTWWNLVSAAVLAEKCRRVAKWSLVNWLCKLNRVEDADEDVDKVKCI